MTERELIREIRSEVEMWSCASGGPGVDTCSHCVLLKMIDDGLVEIGRQNKLTKLLKTCNIWSDGEVKQVDVMGKWKRDSDGFEVLCGCDRPVSDMKLTMVYIHKLQVLDSMPTEISYGGHEDYDQSTELKCDCGKTYKEGEDYKLEWTEQDWGWMWTLEVEMEVQE